MATILDSIVETKRGEIEANKQARPAAEVDAAVARAAPPRDFYAAVTAGNETRLIAEIKRSSPSAGLIRADFEPASIARIYAASGAAALSVLTDQTYFGGSLSFIEAVKQAASLPVLRKDFIIDEYQIAESRAAGADAILLIAEVLSVEQIDRFARHAAGLGMSSLVEVHDAGQLDAVRGLLSAERRILLGVNNRDLRRQRVDVETTFRLAKRLPPGIPFVSESGIRTRADVLRLAEAGARILLIGEALLRSPDVGSKVRELLGQA